MTLNVGRLVILIPCRQHRDWLSVLMFMMGTPLSALTPCFSPPKSHRKGKPEPVRLSKKPKQTKARKITHVVAELPSMRFPTSYSKPFLGKAKMKTRKKDKKVEVMPEANEPACSTVREVVASTPVATPVDTNVTTRATAHGSISNSGSHSPNLSSDYEPTISESTTSARREVSEDEPVSLRMSIDEKPGQHPALLIADNDAVVALDHTTMEVPLAISDSAQKRPKIQLTIPEQQSVSFTYVPHRTKSVTERDGTPASAVSLPSPTAKQRTGTCTSTMRLSIVSPISVMEMPKPRRPFSTWSFAPTRQDSRVEKAVLASPEPKSSSPGSSDETADDEASSYSPRSSMSSFSTNGTVMPLGDQRGSVAFSIVSPARAGIFDEIPPTPKIPILKKSFLSLAESVNKPLPPEPSVIEVAPLLPAGRPCSRTTSMSSKLGLCIPKSSPSPINIPSRKSSGISLLSKYSNTDLRALDALDDAFQRSSPPKIFFGDAHQRTPTLSQVEEALQAQLATISEHVPSQSDLVPWWHDPLQIGRGPMQMKPSRAVPPPPPVSEPLSMSRRRDRRKSTLHVAQQIKAAETDNLRKRGSVPSGGHGKWTAKVHNVFAKANSRTSTPMEREVSSDSNWSFDDSKRSLGSMPDLTADDTSGSEVSSFPEIVVAEVKERLELLTATDRSESTSSFSGASLTEYDEVKERLQLLSVPRDSNIATPEERISSINVSIDLPIQQKNTDHTHSISADVSNVGLSARRGRQADRLVHSMGSLANVDIPELYANMPAYDPEGPRSMSAEELKRQISEEAAEKVLLRILQSLDNLQDLFAAAVISRGFYTIFKRNELPLMKNAVHAMSPAAWELREMSPPYTASCDMDNDAPVPEYTPATYLRHYTRDMYIMVALKSLILVHCESFLRPETISALAGTESARSAEIDEAFWRVWTFCRIFGCGKNREDDIVGQMDWLNGGDLAGRQSTTTSLSMTDPFGMNSVLFSPPPSFAKGNRDGLTAEELYDMTEIWTCLGVLVRGFQGKAEQAREYGIFENADIFPGDVDKENTILGSYPLLSHDWHKANDLCRRMDVPSLNARPCDHPRPRRCILSNGQHLRSGTFQWLDIMAATRFRLFQVHLPQRSCISRLRGENHETHVLTKGHW